MLKHGYKYNENKISFRIKELRFAFIIQTETDIKINVTIFSILKLLEHLNLSDLI